MNIYLAIFAIKNQPITSVHVGLTLGFKLYCTGKMGLYKQCSHLCVLNK